MASPQSKPALFSGCFLQIAILFAIGIIVFVWMDIRNRNYEKRDRAVAAAESRRMAAEEEYGAMPQVREGPLGDIKIPSALKNALQSRLRDPGSLLIRSASFPARDIRNERKCWVVNVTYSARNGFGGMDAAVATGWLRGESLIDISVVE